MKLLVSNYDFVFEYPDFPLVRTSLEVTGGPLVDLGCGTGRTLAAAAAEGFEVYGLDLDPEMTAVARCKLAGTSGVVVTGDMLQVPLPETGTATCLANTYAMLLDRRERVALIRRVAAALRPGGRFVILVKNVAPAESTRSVIRTPPAAGPGFRFELAWDEFPARRERIYHMTFTNGAHIEEHFVPTRILDAHEVRTELVEGGLRPLALYGDYDQSPYRIDSPFHIHVAEACR